MSAQLVFISLFLGLISGPQRVELQAGPAIKSVHILLDGRQVAALQQPPWRATIDFGTSITPGKLVAAGYDGEGREVARVEQFVNLPRPAAEFVIALQNDADGVPRSAELRWEHLMAMKPVRSSLTVDGQAVPLDQLTRARLPRLDMNHAHVIAAEMHFEDGFSARRELVVGGAVSDTVDADLTPLGVRQSTAMPHATPGDCFTSDGSPVRLAAIEESQALVIFVLDPDPREGIQSLNPKYSPGAFWNGAADLRHLIPLDPGTRMRILWPVAKRFKTTSNASSVMFTPSKDIDSSASGLVWLLTRFYDQPVSDDAPRQIADAVGVAGLNAITGAHRRAVVLILSRYKDSGIHDSATVRNYLASIGVPLFVWSLSGPHPDLRDAWGVIDDVSSPQKLKAAADRLRANLATQRVAWVATDPLTALRIQPTGECGITPLAHTQE